MAENPCHLTYELNRRQRLVPHLAIWSRYLPGIGIVAAGVVLAAIYLSAWLSPLILLPLWWGRGFIIGLLDVVFRPVRQMDVILDEKALGFLAGGERWWLWLDGFVSIKRYTRDTWTLFHFNGHVIHIPATAIAEEQIEFIRQAAARGSTPEGMQAVIERGRLIEQMEEEERRRGAGQTDSGDATDDP
jgi:hypothetical protein